MPRGGPRGPTPGDDDTKLWPVQHAESFGGVVVRDEGAGPEIALTRRRTLRGRSVWGLPKGGREPGESDEEAALREVREETGFEAEIVATLEPITYWFAWPPERVRYRKTVRWFLMEARGGDPALHDDEVEEVRFFPVKDAVRRAAYSSEKQVLREAAGRLSGA